MRARLRKTPSAKAVGTPRTILYHGNRAVRGVPTALVKVFFFFGRETSVLVQDWVMKLAEGRV